MRSSLARIVLLCLLGFLGVGALFGGGVLIISPSGSIFGMPLRLLRDSPFRSFLIPGIILFTILGLVPVILVYALIKRPLNKFAELFNCSKDMYWAWTYSTYVAIALIIWLQTEMTMLNAVHWSHSLYLGIAVCILFVAQLPAIRHFYKAERRAPAQASLQH